MPHVSFVRLHVQALAARLSDDFTDVQVMLHAFLDVRDARRVVTGRPELVRHVRVATHQRSRRLVQRRALRLALLQV